jgi:hypothetical protein
MREPLTLTPGQLHTLRHMLGINDPRKAKPEPWRNYAATSPGDPEFLELERLGMVERYRQAGPGNSYDYYRCTDAGRSAACASFKTIRWSKSKRIYSKFLDVRDALGDVTFKEFLTNPVFAETRRSA